MDNDIWHGKCDICHQKVRMTKRADGGTQAHCPRCGPHRYGWPFVNA